jgi:hypothetical protein
MEKNSAASDDTASKIQGGGYVGARTRQPPTAQTHKNAWKNARKKISVGQGACVPWHPDPHLDCCV